MDSSPKKKILSLIRPNFLLNLINLAVILFILSNKKVFCFEGLFCYSYIYIYTKI